MNVDEIHVYVDGSCSGGRGPAALGVFCEFILEGQHTAVELGEFLGQGTNNIAELTAIARGLHVLQTVPDWMERRVTLFSDSEYAIGVLTKNWQPTSNIEIISATKTELAKVPHAHIRHVKGHTGVRGNHIADRIAYACRKREMSTTLTYPVTDPESKLARSI